jgi:F-type H+-transporting ATPase subunit c
MIQASKIIGTDLATTGLIDAGVGIGVVFGALILGVARNPSRSKGRGQLFSYAILRFSYVFRGICCRFVRAYLPSCFGMFIIS